jgi:hypothetical protein
MIGSVNDGVDESWSQILAIHHGLSIGLMRENCQDICDKCFDCNGLESRRKVAARVVSAKSSL